MTTTVTDAPAAPRVYPLLHLGHPDDHLPGLEMPREASSPVRGWVLLIGLAAAVGAACLAWRLGAWSAGAAVPRVAAGWAIPFALLLLAIAVMPFLAKHFWERYYAWVSIGLGLVVAGYYIVGLGAGRAIAGSLSEYISFIILLGSLFIISGGILVRVRGTATPAANTTLLLAGAILANVFGTTGAAMLLIRPFLRMNKGHLGPYHVVFFIFLIANVGGALTPIGDPPLFLGYLKGVPFWWVLAHCWPMWALAVGLLLAAFFVVDSWHHRQTPRHPNHEGDLGPTVSLYGAANILFIAMVLGGVFLPAPFREILMVLAAGGSLATTPRRLHVENHFNFAPIKEVALLFIGIFATMVPALNYLRTHADDAEFKRYLETPGQYYFMAGGLSSVLDNAPTYLTYLESQLGKTDPVVADRLKAAAARPDDALTAADLAGLAPAQREQLAGALAALRRAHPVESGTAHAIDANAIPMALLTGDSGLARFLIAISLGAVFFGACTYIGNGPNFMVKSIADQAGAKTPSFFGYILCYTLPLLLPIFILVWWIFLRAPAT